MTIRIQCSNCGKVYGAEDSRAGETARCTCGHPIPLPLPPAPPGPPPPAAPSPARPTGSFDFWAVLRDAGRLVFTRPVVPLSTLFAMVLAGVGLGVAVPFPWEGMVPGRRGPLQRAGRGGRGRARQAGA